MIFWLLSRLIQKPQEPQEHRVVQHVRGRFNSKKRREKQHTLRKTKAHENVWLEDDFPFAKAIRGYGSLN